MLLIKSRDKAGNRCLYALYSTPELLGDCCKFLRNMGHTQLKLVPELEPAEVFDILTHEMAFLGNGQVPIPEQILDPGGFQLKLPIKKEEN